MGVVHEAERTDDGVRVALKLLRGDLLHQEKAVYRFEREARLSSRIESRHVVRTLDAGVDPKVGLPWLCMELVAHGSLVDWVDARRPIGRAMAGAILAQIFDAVGAAHRAGIVHRDLKPENVLVAEPGGYGEPPLVKVSDFGVAKGLTDQSWSATEAGLGTPLWTSPEQSKEGYVPTARSDVWALGLVTYWLLVGRQFWRAADQRGGLMDVILEMQEKSVAVPSERAREQGATSLLPPGFDQWFARAVTHDVSARFADASVAWDALQPLLVERAAAVVETPAALPQPTPRRPWVAVAIALAVLLAVSAVVLALR